MYAFLQPATLAEATALLQDKENLRILAGGTDLIIALNNRSIPCDFLMDCKKIPELGVLEITSQGLEIGSAVTLNEMIHSPLLQGPYDVLRQGAAVLANTLLRNRATLTGNLCNASPGGDMLPPCLVLGGWVEAVSAGGTRRIPLKEFFTGVKRHALAADEMVTKAVFPPIQGLGFYRKRKRIQGHDLAQVGVAAFHETGGAFRLALGAVGPTPVLLDDLGTLDKAGLQSQRNAILERVTASISPISDVRSSKEYRTAMATYLTGQIIDILTEGMEVGA